MELSENDQTTGNTDRFKTNYEIDKTAHPDSENVRICGREINLGAVRKMYEKFDETKYKMFSFYDDMFQYTSLGLLDVVFDVHKISSPIPVKSFFARKCIYGKDFVYDIAARFNIKRDDIDQIEKERYGEIIMRSPLTPNAKGLLSLRPILDSQILVFKYPFDGINTIVREIKETYGKDEYISLEVDYRENLTEQHYYEKKINKVKLSYFDIAVCQDAASLLEFMESKGLQDTIILTDFEHCGLSKEAKYVYEMLTEGIGPRNTRIYYLKEGI